MDDRKGYSSAYNITEEKDDKKDAQINQPPMFNLDSND